jgi:hypothetical protein
METRTRARCAGRTVFSCQADKNEGPIPLLLKENHNG